MWAGKKEREVSRKGIFARPPRPPKACRVARRVVGGGAFCLEQKSTPKHFSFLVLI